MCKIVISRITVEGDTAPSGFEWLLCDATGDVRCAGPEAFDTEYEARLHALNTLRMVTPAINAGHGLPVEVQDITIPSLPAALMLPAVGA